MLSVAPEFKAEFASHFLLQCAEAESVWNRGLEDVVAPYCHQEMQSASALNCLDLGYAGRLFAVFINYRHHCRCYRPP